ncbi:MAG: HypC/HybG/HupF family hydrogenase formation chaperone [Peptococcaceae bacterium]|nr:HypC/HybG/HupF family hydrogenase formation chaperone [Peptococcaceae bacterium]
MCLAVPLKILSVDGDMAEAGIKTTRVRISIALTPGIGIGDWVLVHAGFAIHSIEEKQALETLELLEELDEFNRQQDNGGPSHR